MSTILSRRDFVGAALATSLLPVLPAAAVTPANSKRLVAGTRVIEVNGRAAKVFGLIGPDGRPGLRLAPDERFQVQLVNEAGAPTIVHWHGQLPPWKQDGFPWPQTPSIGNGAAQAYDYAPIPGTYWMHSHHEMQEQNLMTAPLIVHDAATLREDRQDVVLMLHDFAFRTPEEVLAELAGAPDDKDSNHKAQSPMSGMAHMSGMTDMPGMANMPGMAMQASGDMQMDLNDVRYDAFLANDRTLADPEIIRVERSGRIRLRVINGASSSQFWIDLGGLTGHVVATDGHSVLPIAGGRFPIALAQRLDILIDLPSVGVFPILARLEGTRQQTGLVLATAGAPVLRIAENGHDTPPVDNSLEARLNAATPLPPRAADMVQTINLGGDMRPYTWALNDEYWPKITPLMLRKGQRVEIDLVNRTMMAHPMHLHGHAFQVVAIDGQTIRGAVRDTVLVPAMGHVRIAFDADNPGRWAFHCHNLYHMMTGMMTEFRYEGIAA
ncbi:MAG: multicopper oxidase family protein [Methylovirgula sp.]